MEQMSQLQDVAYQISKVDANDKLLMNENANKDPQTFSGKRDMIAGQASKAKGMGILPVEVAEAHARGDIHFHDLDYSPYTPYTNCFSVDTEFVTSKGVFSFSHFSDGDEIQVLTPKGIYKKATVKKYGKQDINKVTFRKGNIQKDIFVTGNHRWILEDSNVTTELKVGDRLTNIPTPMTINIFAEKNQDIIDGWIDGFIFGDGGKTNYQNPKYNEGVALRLCGGKIQYENIFTKNGFTKTSPKYIKNDDVALYSGSRKKRMADLSKSIDYIRGYVDGYLSADGSYRNNNKTMKAILTAKGNQVHDMIRNIFPIANYFIASEDDLTGKSTNFLKSRKETTTFRFITGNHFKWKVVNIEESVKNEEVWCLEVEDEQAFMLKDGIPTGNCCLIDIEFMQEHGFKMGNAEIDTPKSIGTAVAQITQIIANVASSQYGGCSVDKIDVILAKYAEMNYEKHLKEAHKWGVSKAEEYAVDKTKKDIYDAMQSLEYEVNTLFTSNGQTPFISIGFGLGEDWIAKEIQKAILNIRIGGLGKEKRTAIFPKLIFVLKDGLNLKETDPNYDVKELALECASKRMYPDVISYHKIKELTGSVKISMGCRSFLQGWKDEEGKEVNSGRMNLGVVTLNLPRIALESETITEFWEKLDERLSIAHKALQARIENVSTALPQQAPILYKEGAFGKRLNDNDDVTQLFKNKRATISLGYIGLYEVGAKFFGRDWENNSEAKDFTLSILSRMKNNCLQWSDEEGVWYSVYGTPSESLTDRFCRLDTDKFGIVENITDKDYYTNSFHYDVRKNPNPFEKLDFEKDYPTYASGGFIHYVEYPNIKQNLKALETVWDYAYTRIGYLGTNTPIDKCYVCDFEGDFKATDKGYECPICGNHDPKKADVTKRLCGYLGQPLARPEVHGRHKEIQARVKHV